MFWILWKSKNIVYLWCQIKVLANQNGQKSQQNCFVARWAAAKTKGALAEDPEWKIGEGGRLTLVTFLCGWNKSNAASKSWIESCGCCFTSRSSSLGVEFFINNSKWYGITSTVLYCIHIDQYAKVLNKLYYLRVLLNVCTLNKFGHT